MFRIFILAYSRILVQGPQNLLTYDLIQPIDTIVWPDSNCSRLTDQRKQTVPSPRAVEEYSSRLVRVFYTDKSADSSLSPTPASCTFSAKQEEEWRGSTSRDTFAIKFCLTHGSALNRSIPPPQLAPFQFLIFLQCQSQIGNASRLGQMLI